MGHLKVAMACGGTGGHIYPAIALADEIKKQNQNIEIVFIGRPQSMEQRIISYTGYKMEYINISGFHRKEWTRNLKFPFLLMDSMIKSRKILKKHLPNVVIGTGAYVSGPVILNSWCMKLPSMILEQNSIPGITTRILSHFTDLVVLAYKESGDFISKKVKKMILGNPIREVKPFDKKELRLKYRLPLDSKIVLIFGGSQGSMAINDNILSSAAEISKAQNIGMIWQTGQRDFARIKGIVNGISNIRIFSYLDPIYDFYGLSDLVVSRAGAMALSEITAFGLPSILVPLPTSVGNHQRKNAMVFKKNGAAVIVEETAEGIWPVILALFDNSSRLQEMSHKSRGLSKPHAVKEIARIVFERWLS